MKTLLLHICCAPCSTHCIELMKNEHKVTLLFSNSNIFPREEYERRLENARKIASFHKIELIEDNYDHNAWLQHIKGLETEPEGGMRCLKCFEFNLGRADSYAGKKGFDFFTTTLTVSPHKNSRAIFGIGKKLDNARFLEIDFKKEDGFRHSTELSRKLGLYRQDYCGCEFSIKK